MRPVLFGAGFRGFGTAGSHGTLPECRRSGSFSRWSGSVRLRDGTGIRSRFLFDVSVEGLDGVDQGDHDHSDPAADGSDIPEKQVQLPVLSQLVEHASGQTGNQVPQRGADEPKPHHLSDERFGRQFGDAA